MKHETTATVIAAVASRYTTELFGIMGNGNALFVDAAIGLGMRYYALRHEAGATAAADAFARSTGGIGVATSTFGAGFTNTLTALAEAVRARSALVLVVGDAPTSGVRPADVDIPALVRGVGAISRTVVRGEEGEAAELAFDDALRLSRPVVLSLPYDLASAPAAAPALFIRQQARPHHEPDIRDEVRVIGDADRLLVIAGRGAVLADGADAVVRFARSRSAMTATTILAHGLFGEYPRHLGVSGGFGSAAAAEVMAQADVVVVLGAALNSHTTRHGAIFSSTATVIQVDVSAEPTSPRVDRFVRMDVARFLQRCDESEVGSGWVGYPRDMALVRTLDLVPSATESLHPQALTTEIARLLPRQKTVVLDGGNFMAWPIAEWSLTGAENFVPAGVAYQSIGLGLPSMIGAAIARRDQLPILATGDGGLLMALADLESVARLVGRGVIVVYNDSAYGAELHQYGPLGLNVGPMTFPTVDLAGVARSLGMKSIVVTAVSDLRHFARWLRNGSDGVILLDCRIAADVAAPFLTVAMAVPVTAEAQL